MTQLADSGIGVYVRGEGRPVLGPDDPGYDDAPAGVERGDRPRGVIARCRSAADVSRAVCARVITDWRSRSGVARAARAGTGAVDDGLMIDLSLINEVTVDPVAKRARIGGGALLGQRSTLRRRSTAWPHRPG